MDAAASLKLLSTERVRQGTSTNFTSVMNPATGDYKTWIQGDTAYPPAPPAEAAAARERDGRARVLVRTLVRGLSGLDL